MLVKDNLFQVQSNFIIIDDLEDGSKMRHGKPCWHLLPEVKNFILNDTCMIRSLINDILKEHLKDPLYTKIIDMLNEVRLLRWVFSINNYINVIWLSAT